MFNFDYRYYFFGYLQTYYFPSDSNKDLKSNTDIYIVPFRKTALRIGEVLGYFSF